MTIFEKIIQAFLSSEITRIYGMSVAADHGSFQFFMGSLGLGRNLDLSAFKRAQLDSLSINIKNTLNMPSDERFFDAIIAHIQLTKTIAAAESRKEKRDEGSFGPEMQHLMDLVRSIFEKVQAIGLLNQLVDNDPLNQFRYFSALYCAKKIFMHHQATYLQRLLRDPNLSSRAELSEKKEALMLRYLTGCCESLAIMRPDNHHEQYQTVYRQFIIDWIEKIERANEALCKEYTMLTTIPVHASVLGAVDLGIPAMGPGLGDLEFCMASAKTVILEQRHGAQIEPSSIERTVKI